MNQVQETIELMKHYRLPNAAEFKDGFQHWKQSDSKWWLMSVVAHGVLLLLVCVVPMAMSEALMAEAPAFDVMIDQTEITQEFSQFEFGEPPIDPTELSTESLSVMEPTAVDAQTEQVIDDSAVFEAPGGSNASDSKAAGVGELGPILISQIVSDGPGASGDSNGPTKAIVPGGSNPGFGSRSSGSRKALLASGGATKETEKSVAGALIWFARHQNVDGSWSLNKHVCRDGACTCSGEGDVASNAAATAFGLLPYLAAGQTHESDGPHKATIARGINWMMLNQGPDGSLAKGSVQPMYTHGLAAIVMCEAYGLSRDKRVGASAQAAVNFIQNAQDKDTGGWWYNPGQKGGDTSVFGWQVMALKSAQMAGLAVDPRSLALCSKWLMSVSKGQKGGLFAYVPDSGASPTMTSVGVLGTQYLGAQRNDPRLVEGMNYFMTQLPNPRARNCYFWYYATQVMHNLPGPEWDQWNRAMRTVLVESQVKEGCALGSWDPNLPTPDPWGKHGGRVMVTSIGALTLEVYYRYLPLYQQMDGDEKNETK